MLNMLAMEALLKSVGNDPDTQELFGGVEAFKAMRAKQALRDDERLRVAQAVLAVFNSEAGRVMFEYLVASTFRRFENVTAYGLPMETAIQLHAEKDGRFGVVNDLLQLVKQAQNPTAKPDEA